MSPSQLDVFVEADVEDGVCGTWPPRIEELIHGIVSRELPIGTYSLGLLLVSDATIQSLNTEHRGKDSATDVLSFPLYEPGFALPPGEPVALGDVIVSYPRAVAQAEEFGHSVERELAYLVAHGVLHVLGYDHEQEDEQREMRRREEEALLPLGFTR
ncbi:MAG: rRNA maturation RNase YbeY [Chloroflexi bacterium]|nr:rRNA maturation RNase YbeY [Chloroflexota bacterium]MBV9542965.1 rRNA maturation RNase YbeY [Chloroflexota bacterium]